MAVGSNPNNPNQGLSPLEQDMIINSYNFSNQSEIRKDIMAQPEVQKHNYHFDCSRHSAATSSSWHAQKFQFVTCL